MKLTLSAQIIFVMSLAFTNIKLNEAKDDLSLSDLNNLVSSQSQSLMMANSYLTKVDQLMYWYNHNYKVMDRLVEEEVQRETEQEAIQALNETFTQIQEKQENLTDWLQNSDSKAQQFEAETRRNIREQGSKSQKGFNEMEHNIQRFKEDVERDSGTHLETTKGHQGVINRLEAELKTQTDNSVEVDGVIRGLGDRLDTLEAQQMSWREQFENATNVLRNEVEYYIQGARDTEVTKQDFVTLMDNTNKVLEKLLEDNRTLT